MGRFSEDEFYEAFGMGEDDLFDTQDFQWSTLQRRTDDGVDTVLLKDQLAKMLDAITRIGGEVCRMRAEMDGLQDQNAEMSQKFEKLRSVIEEKGALDMDDFQLACDVIQSKNSNSPMEPAPSAQNNAKKFTH